MCEQCTPIIILGVSQHPLSRVTVSGPFYSVSADGTPYYILKEGEGHCAWSLQLTGEQLACLRDAISNRLCAPKPIANNLSHLPASSFKVATLADGETIEVRE